MSVGDPRIDAILTVMRNGRERTASEVAERLREDHGIEIGGADVGRLMHRVPGVMFTGKVHFIGGSATCWKLETAEAAQ